MPYKPIYNWSDWFARPYFEIKQGVNFEISLSSMSQQIRNMAKKYDKIVHIKEERNGTLKVELVDRTDEPYIPTGYLPTEVGI